MVRKSFLIIALMSFGLAAFAGDPWKDKSWREWDEKDLARVMADSPWSRPAKVDATWKDARGRAQGLSPDSSADSGAPTTIRGTSEGGSYGGNPQGPNVGPRTDRNDPRYAQAVFIVRWTSSRTLRQAVARLNMQRGMPVADAEKIVAQQPQAHEIIVFGEDMTPFANVTAEELRAKTHLTLKSAKQEISPRAAAVRRSPDGKQILAAVFEFPMNSEAGALLISAKEKGAEFHCQVRRTSIKVNFEPGKMISKDGAEF